MKAVLPLLLGVAYATSIWQQERIANFDEVDHFLAFKDWMEAFNKTYSGVAEQDHRFLLFLDTWKKINNHNLYDGEVWQMGHNQFSDLTQQEFEDMTSCDYDEAASRTESVELNEADEVDWITAPDSIDWSNHNGADWTTPIKNQGSCGSCWAFCSTAALESRSAIKNGTARNIISLSEQELVDCCKTNSGCNGGRSVNSYKYVASTGGLCLESAYKYTAKDGTCKSSTCSHKDAVNKNSPSTHVATDSAAGLLAATATGPVTCRVDASSWHSYKSGVFTGSCGTAINHCVTTVGYGTASTGGDYWKVRNSWGASWGMNGYILVCRNCNKNGNQGQCAINHDDCYPNV